MGIEQTSYIQEPKNACSLSMMISNPGLVQYPDRAKANIDGDAHEDS